VWVDELVPGTPADLSGKIEVGDSLIEINGIDVSEIRKSDVLTKDTLGAQHVTLLVRRYGAQSEILAIMRHEKNVEQAANLDIDLEGIEDADDENGGGRGMKRRTSFVKTLPAEEADFRAELELGGDVEQLEFETTLKV
jgi:hypothetical protein